MSRVGGGHGRFSHLIPKELLDEVDRWQAPDVTDPNAFVKKKKQEEPEEALPQPPTVEEIEAIQKQAFEEGYAAGLVEGRVAGQAEFDARIAETEQERARLIEKGGELEVLMEALIHPFEELDEEVEKEVAKLAMLVASQVVRRELHIDPGQVIAAVREAAAALPVAARSVQLHLHPEDAALVREALSLHEGEQAWRLMEDVRISRGGCEVVAEDSRIDATVEKRLQVLIAGALGDERGDDDRS
ncbi:FliH/SctL family protein [Endothiovibrio diazotrophicus]